MSRLVDVGRQHSLEILRLVTHPDAGQLVPLLYPLLIRFLELAVRRTALLHDELGLGQRRRLHELLDRLNLA